MEKIPASEIGRHLADRVLIDVRSPAEYERAHIPSALNMPLFDNEERAKVGTIYKQISPEQALIRGLEFVGPKMADFVKQASKWASNKKILLYCWRGGKRSGSVAWLLRFAGFDVVTVEGGYKNYRQEVLQSFDNQQLRLIVLGGKTGSGKTFILRELARQNEQIIDLEAIAHHKGSAFGWVGEQKQGTTEQFENDLHAFLRYIDPTRRIWIENENQAIGSVFVPQGLWQQMKNAPLLHIEVPLENRVQHLVDVYGSTSKEALVLSFEKIVKKLGFDQAKNAIEAVKSDNYAEAARIGLTYYDKAYIKSFETNTTLQKHILHPPQYNYEKTARELIDFANSYHL
jgi:tRNA 2-selenouridine synthase